MMPADTERLTCAENYQELTTQLQLLDARLAVVGVCRGIRSRRTARGAAGRRRRAVFGLERTPDVAW
jgi:hypothetical protein